MRHDDSEQERLPKDDAGPLLAASSKRPRLTYALACCVTYNLFANHWNRDSIGALELPLENDPTFGFSVRQYNSLSAAYFAPNIPVPFVAGVLSQIYGPALIYVGFGAAAFCGNVLFAAAALTPPRYPLLLSGRVITGIAYEALDMVPIGLLSPRFEGQWGTMVGVINGVNRLGSVLNFLLEPLILRSRGGAAAALLLPALLGASMLPCCLAAWHIDRTLRRRAQAKALADAQAEAAQSGVGSDAAAVQPAEGRLTLSIATLPATIRRFTATYWLFLLGSMCVYGSVVPFWFIGAKHIALRWDMGLAAADAYLLWPEGSIALVAPPFGLLIDRHKWSFERRLVVSAVSLLAVSASLLALAWLPLPPVIGVCMLGLGYACAQNLIWSTVPLASPPELLNLSAGLIGCAVNVLPMLLPAVAFDGNGSRDCTILAAVGALGFVALAAGACIERSRRTRTQRGRGGGAGGRAWLSGSQLPELPAPEGAALPPTDEDPPQHHHGGGGGFGE